MNRELWATRPGLLTIRQAWRTRRLEARQPQTHHCYLRGPVWQNSLGISQKVSWRYCMDSPLAFPQEFCGLEGGRQDNGIVTSEIQGEADDPASCPTRASRMAARAGQFHGGSPLWRGTMHPTQVRHLSARIQRETGQPRCRPRQRGPPARTSCDLTKHHFICPVPARTGGLSAAYQPDREGFSASNILRRR